MYIYIYRYVYTYNTLRLSFMYVIISITCCATNQKVDGSIPDGVVGIFH